MAKELKRIIVKDFQRRFAGMDGCVVIDYRGLNSEQTTDLRSALREESVVMNVVHNRLAKNAFSSLERFPAEFEQFFRGPTALLWGEEGVISASRIVTRWQKKNRGLARVKGALFEGEILTEADVKKLALIPDREALRGRLAAMFASPLQFLASAARSLLENFAGAAQARRADLESKE
jgi:large subunit ribosomal protein L10